MRAIASLRPSLWCSLAVGVCIMLSWLVWYAEGRAATRWPVLLLPAEFVVQIVAGVLTLACVVLCLIEISPRQHSRWPSGVAICLLPFFWLVLPKLEPANLFVKGMRDRLLGGATVDQLREICVQGRRLAEAGDFRGYEISELLDSRARGASSTEQEGHLAEILAKPEAAGLRCFRMAVSYPPHFGFESGSGLTGRWGLRYTSSGVAPLEDEYEFEAIAPDLALFIGP